MHNQVEGNLEINWKWTICHDHLMPWKEVAKETSRKLV